MQKLGLDFTQSSTGQKFRMSNQLLNYLIIAGLIQREGVRKMVKDNIEELEKEEL